MTISHKLAWTKEAWEPCTSTLPLITPYTDPVQEHSTPSTHLHISVISKSREKFKPDHHRHLTEHKHILKGLTDSGPPHYWSYAGQVFHSLVNHTVHICMGAPSMPEQHLTCLWWPQALPSSRPAQNTNSLLMQQQALLFPQWLWSKHKITSFSQFVGRRKEQRYDQITSFEPTLCWHIHSNFFLDWEAEDLTANILVRISGDNQTSLSLDQGIRTVETVSLFQALLNTPSQ